MGIGGAPNRQLRAVAGGPFACLNAAVRHRCAATVLMRQDGAVRRSARTQALCLLHALVVDAPEILPCRLRRLGTEALATRCSQLRQRQAQQCLELQVTIQALRSVARRAEALGIEAV